MRSLPSMCPMRGLRHICGAKLFWQARAATLVRSREQDMSRTDAESFPYHGRPVIFTPYTRIVHDLQQTDRGAGRATSHVDISPTVCPYALLNRRGVTALCAGVSWKSLSGLSCSPKSLSRSRRATRENCLIRRPARDNSTRRQTRDWLLPYNMCIPLRLPDTKHFAPE